MRIMDTFNKAKAAKLNPKTARLIKRLQKASFNSDQGEVDRIMEELNKNPEIINEINRHDPSLLIAVGRLMPYNRDKLEDIVKDSIKNSIEIEI